MKNKYEIRDDGVVIFIQRKSGDVIKAIVDKDDLPKLIELNTTFTVSMRITGQFNVTYWKNSKNYLLARFILDFPKGFFVDHINHDTLDNRKSNLRVVTHSENMQNQGKLHKNNTSGYRGVTYCFSRKRTKKPWRVRVAVSGRQQTFGYYATKEEAGAIAADVRRKYMPCSPEALGGEPC